MFDEASWVIVVSPDAGRRLLDRETRVRSSANLYGWIHQNPGYFSAQFLVPDAVYDSEQILVQCDLDII